MAAVARAAAKVAAQLGNQDSQEERAFADPCISGSSSRNNSSDRVPTFILAYRMTWALTMLPPVVRAVARRLLAATFLHLLHHGGLRTAETGCRSSSRVR